MSTVLYYSKYCKNCDSIISRLSKTSIQKDIHFICIDKRVKEGNKIYLLLEGGKKVLLPETVKKVPAILLLYQGYRVLYGKDIMNYYQPKINAETGIATQNNLEPSVRIAFCIELQSQNTQVFYTHGPQAAQAERHQL